MDDVTVKLPSWQACESCGADVVPQIEAKISQNAAYGGIEVGIGTMQIYIEQDAERGVVVSIWRDHDAGGDPDHQHEFALKEIGLEN